MPKNNVTFRTINTVDKVTLHVYEDENGKVKPHSLSGPAIIYPKDYGKQDEYCIYGINYNYDKWLELSRAVRSSITKEDFIDY